MNNNTSKGFSTRRKTTEQYKREVESSTNGQYLVVGEYKNNKTPIKYLHNVCGNTFEVMPNRFRKKCPYCDDGMHQTQETIEYKVRKRTNGEYSLIGKYTKSKNKSKFLHNVCGSEFVVRVNDFMSGRSRCKKCGTEKRIEAHRKTHDEFVKEIENKFGGNIQVLSEYKSSVDGVRFKCKKHNETFVSTPNSMLTTVKYGCEICLDESRERKYTIDDVHSYLQSTNIRLLSDEYKTTVDDLEFLCLECDRKFISCMHTITRRNMKRCKGCSIAQTNKMDIEEIKKYIEENTTAKLLPSKHMNSASKLNLLCECGEVFQASWLKITQNNKTRCNKCSVRVSNAEYKTMRYLDSVEAIYKYEYAFDDLRNIQGDYYRFDFAILDEYGNVETLIELDGQQHFMPVASWGGEEALKRIQYNDAVKNRYCLDNKINLIRIPYWEFDNIEEILKTKLPQKQLTLL